MIPLYSSINDQTPARMMALPELAELIEHPSVGPKDKAAALTPYTAHGKTKQAAVDAPFWGVVKDHDHDDRSAEQLRALYDGFGVAWMAWSTASHLQPKDGIAANRWKVVLPLAQQASYADVLPLALGSDLILGTDKAQSRVQQVFYAPNKVSPAAPYLGMTRLDLPLLDPSDTTHPLVRQCREEYEEAERKQAERAAAAVALKVRSPAPRQGGSVIEAVNAAYDLGNLLEHHGYARIGRKWLSPASKSGNPGVVVLRGDDGRERVYSHHGEADPLSSLNHSGHALDAFDVLCCLDYGGDVRRAVRELRPRVSAPPPTIVLRGAESPAKAPEKPPEPPQEVQQATSWPEPFRGAMAALHAQILLASPKPQPKLSLLAVMIGMAGAVSGIYRLEDGMRCNLYGLGVAESGDGKDAPQQIAAEIATAAGAKRLGQPASGEGLEDALESRRGILCVLDEVAHVIASLNTRNAPAHLLSMARNLLTLFSAGRQKYVKRQRAADKKTGRPEEPEVILYPCFSLLGFATPEKLGAAATVDNVKDGLLGRMLFAIGADSPPHVRIRHQAEIPPEVERVAQQIGNARMLVGDGDRGNLEAYVNPEIVIGVTPGADAFLGDVLKLFDEQGRRAADAPLRRALSARSYEKVLRIAGVLAVWDTPAAPLIEHEHVGWALHAVSASNADAERFLTEYLHGGVVQANGAEILRHLSRIKRTKQVQAVAHSELLKAVSRKMDAAGFAAAVDHLAQMNELEVIEGRTPAGRPLYRYA